MIGRQDTIYAVSSGSLPSGVAVVRVSGPKSRFVAETLIGCLPKPRTASLQKIKNVAGDLLLDVGLVLWFPGPNSFSGEDSLEFQLHGGRATVSALFVELSKIEGLRVADAGEFSRRAFENGKLDLVEVEGLADLVAAQTEAQRKRALLVAGGYQSDRYEHWRHRLIRQRAYLEAAFDFSDEDDVSDDVADKVWEEISALAEEIRFHLSDSNAGEIIRGGYRVVLAGAPNVGKSTLLNRVSERDVAIVTDIAGTTRDVLEVDIDLGGYLVKLIDTAGLRETDDVIEAEGIARAKAAMNEADLILWLDQDGVFRGDIESKNHIKVVTKDDGLVWSGDAISISAKEGKGIGVLISAIEEKLVKHVSIAGENNVVVRQRHRDALSRVFDSLQKSLEAKEMGIEVRSELIRQASDHLASITGRIDVEDMLDVIFSEFCIGK